MKIYLTDRLIGYVIPRILWANLKSTPLNLGSFREYVLIMKMLFRLIFTWNHTYYLTTRTYHLVVTTYYIYGGHQFKIIYFVLLS